jgi:hypothetical protein
MIRVGEEEKITIKKGNRESDEELQREDEEVRMNDSNP